MTLSGGIQDTNKQRRRCQSAAPGRLVCNREADAKCAHCGRHFCGSHIAFHLARNHQVNTRALTGHRRTW